MGETTQRTLTVVEHGPITKSPTFADVVAASKEMPADAVKTLFEVWERMTDRAAAQEFAEAMAAFHEECPAIPKTAEARIATRGGGEYSYTYATLESIAKLVNPLLHKRGLSYTWDSSESEGAVKAECIVRHVNGHKVSSSFSCKTDTAAAMSGAQKSAAANTYAKRQSLIGALGLTTTDPDADGAEGEYISEHQVANLKLLIEEVKPNLAGFLKTFGVAKIEDLVKANYAPAVNMLTSKRKG